MDTIQERIPHPEQATGVACHYDQPGARPPHTLLLAVPPSPTQAWRWDDLVATVHETLDMAKIRAVDLEANDDIGHHLPAIVLAINEERATASSDLVGYLDPS